MSTVRFLCVVLVSFMAASCRAGVDAGADEKKSPPNIVIIYADDLGIGDVTCFNPGSKIPTPHIDAMAKEGMRFTDAHSGHCICSPSRYSLLTGRYSWRGPLPRGIVWHWGAPVLPTGKINMASLLDKAGYFTACVGKWHLGWNWPSSDSPAVMKKNQGKNVDFSKPITGGPIDYGFDYYFGEEVINLPPYIWIENDRCLKAPTTTYRDYAPGPAIEDWNPTDVLPKDTQKTVELIRKSAREKKPFFIFLSLPSPHLPHVPTDQFKGKAPIGLYGDYVAQTDHTVGQVVKALKETGQFDNTLLIFTSDHGSRQLQLAEQGHRTNGVYCGGKWSNWEGGYRIPMVVTWPGKVKPGTDNDQLVSQVDLLATFAAITGQKIPAGDAEDSIDILPTLLDPEKKVRDEVVQLDNGGKWALRKGDWKYYEAPRDKLIPIEKGPALFNLANDPGERAKVNEKNPEKVREMATRLQEYKDIYQKIREQGKKQAARR